MSEINVGENIQRLRKEKNITQEQLADMIGVTASAVSKWENGNSTPDIMLLSPLARALNSSVDVILSFRQELSDEEVTKIKKELSDIFLHESYDLALEKCKQYLKEYPNSILLKLSIAGLVQMYSMLDDSEEELMKGRLSYALSLLEEVVKSKESKYISTAYYVIANIYLILEDYERSENALKEILNMVIDPKFLYAALYERQGKKKEAEKYCKQMLLKNVTECTALLSILSRLSKEEKDYERTIIYLNTVVNLEDTFQIGLASGSYRLYQLYLELEKKELSVTWFSKFVDDLLSIGYDYSNSRYFNNIELEVDLNGQKIIRQKFYKSILSEVENVERLNYPEYKEAIQKLKNEIVEP